MWGAEGDIWMVCGWGLVGGFKLDFLFFSYFFLFNWLIIGALCVDFQISIFECAYLKRVVLWVWGILGVIWWRICRCRFGGIFLRD